MDDTGDGHCRFCEVAPAVLGLLAAAVIVFVSVDLITGGRLTVTALSLFGAGEGGEHGNAEPDG